MARCLMAYQRQGKFFRIPDAEIEDWDEVREELESPPRLIQRLEGWDPYTHAYRMPNGSIYLVEGGDEN